MLRDALLIAPSWVFFVAFFTLASRRAACRERLLKHELEALHEALSRARYELAEATLAKHHVEQRLEREGSIHA